MTQHVRITLEQAKDLYQMGVCNTTTLVLFFFRIKLAEGWTGKFTNREIFQKLGISEASFYRAIAFLRVQGLLFWKTKGVTEYALNPETLYGEDEPVKVSPRKPSRNAEGGTLTIERTTVRCESPDSQGCESPLSEVSVETLKVESDSCKVEGEKTPQPTQSMASSPSTDLFQLYFNSLSTSLKGLSEDETEINSFLEWWTAEMNTFSQPIRNPIAFLRSIDSNTGQERLATQWLLWKQGQAPKKPRKRSYNDEWERIVGLSARMSLGQRTESLIADPRLLKATRDAGGLWKIGMTSNSTDLQKLKAAFVSSLKEQDGVFDG